MPGMTTNEAVRPYTQNRVAPKPSERIVLPSRPENNASFEAGLYDRFIHHLRHVPNSRMEIKILSAIQFTADSIDHGDALVAKTLVDLGLRAPRKAFPVSFLEFVDRSIARQGWDLGSYACGVCGAKRACGDGLIPFIVIPAKAGIHAIGRRSERLPR